MRVRKGVQCAKATEWGPGLGLQPMAEEWSADGSTQLSLWQEQVHHVIPSTFLAAEPPALTLYNLVRVLFYT